MKELKFSLVLCTVGKTKDLEEFLICLKNQDYKRFQLIIVDQNDDNRVDKIISSYCKSMDILHVKSEKGLSKARNVGIGFCDGDIVAFPDDDCIYPTTMLAEINAFFNKEHYDILSIKMTNNVPSGRKIQEGIESQQVTRKNVLKLMASISMFYKVHVIESVGSFDENLGLGAKTIYQGGEDYDYPLRALKKDYNIFFDNTIHVLHPWDDKEIELNKNLESKSFKGGAAEMFLLNKHKFSNLYKIQRILRRGIIVLYYGLKCDFYKSRLSFLILKGMLSEFSNISNNINV